MSTTFDPILSDLKQRSKLLVDSAIQINSLHFEQPQSNLFQLVDSDGNRHSLSFVALRQLCRIAKVPFSFIVRNTAELNQEILNQYISTIDETYVFRETSSALKELATSAIIPVGQAIVNDGDIFQVLKDSVSAKMTVNLFNAGYIDNFNSIYRVLLRVIFPEKYPIGIGPAKDNFQLGFYLVSSELGCCPLIVEPMLFGSTYENTALTTYNNGPYYRNNYRGIAAADLRGVFSNAMSRLETDMVSYKDRIENALNTILNETQMKELWAVLKDRRGVSKGFLTKVEQDLIANFNTSHTMSKWSIVSRLMDLAKTLPESSRFAHERLSGELLGLKFYTNQATRVA